MADETRPQYPRCLIADIPPTHPRIARALVGFDLEFVTNLASAVNALRERAFDFVVIGIDLEESNALYVVQRIREIVPQTPLICIRAAEPKYRILNTTVHGFRLACEAVGARGLVNFFDFTDDAVGDAAIRSVIEGLRGAATGSPAGGAEPKGIA
jgi:CheY-like chemotaxis protein